MFEIDIFVLGKFLFDEAGEDLSVYGQGLASRYFGILCSLGISELRLLSSRLRQPLAEVVSVDLNELEQTSSAGFPLLWAGVSRFGRIS